MQEILLCDENDTARLARIVARFLRPVDCLTLAGDLGAGKTTFMRYIIAALSNIPPEVVSPSFMIMQEYPVFVGALPPSLALPPPLRASHLLGKERIPSTLYHLDGYRLNDASEIPELGLEEMLENGIVAIEWPDRFIGWLPKDRLELEIRVKGAQTRKVTIAGRGKHAGTATQIHDQFTRHSD
jgi:tRNA A37 threonylcarbamoyladenosine biosynthesis protein TsaE